MSEMVCSQLVVFSELWSETVMSQSVLNNPSRGLGEVHPSGNVQGTSHPQQARI